MLLLVTLTIIINIVLINSERVINKTFYFMNIAIIIMIFDDKFIVYVMPLMYFCYSFKVRHSVMIFECNTYNILF